MKIKISYEQYKVLYIIKQELLKYDVNDVISIKHKNPVHGNVRHRVGWILKQVNKVMDENIYYAEHTRTLNSLREYFIERIESRWNTFEVQR